MDYLFILEQYRKLWNNRLLSASNDESEYILKNAIKRELLDENSHPRIRKTKHEKYCLAVKRILASSLDKDIKLIFIELYTNLLDQV